MSSTKPRPSRRKAQSEAEPLRLALPSKGELEEPCVKFLADCGLAVERPSLRGYTGAIPALPGASVIFQRAADIADKVEEGSADLGITGLDTVHEAQREDGDTLIVIEDLGFGGCQLVVAVPDPWIDVSNMADLVDLSLQMREQGRILRVATRYPRLLQRFFLNRGLYNYRAVEVSGALEAAPTMGYADIICDLTATGATLRDNHLKPLPDGVVLVSQACLVGHRGNLSASPAKLENARTLLEFAEARMKARGFRMLSARVQGRNAREVERKVIRQAALALDGLTMAPALGDGNYGEGWWALSGVVPSSRVLEMVTALRQLGACQVVVSAPGYLFQESSGYYQRLVQRLDHAGSTSS